MSRPVCLMWQASWTACGRGAFGPPLPSWVTHDRAQATCPACLRKAAEVPRRLNRNARPSISAAGSPIWVSRCCGGKLEPIPGGTIATTRDANCQCSRCGRDAHIHTTTENS